MASVNIGINLEENKNIILYTAVLLLNADLFFLYTAANFVQY